MAEGGDFKLENRPIIVKKIKKGHGGGHGSAWKVAFADFMSAMMALFLVLWLVNSKKEVKQAVGAYFRDPPGIFSSTSGGGAGILEGGTGREASTAQGEDASAEKQREMKEKVFKALQSTLEGAIKNIPELQKLKDQIAIQATAEGVRIELLDKESSSFFEPGSARIRPEANVALKAIVEQIRRLPYSIIIEGHTDSQPLTRPGYSNWELSADRANITRRMLESLGLDEGKIAQVRGYADKRLRYPANPEDPRNRRISIVVAEDTKEIIRPDLPGVSPVVRDLIRPQSVPRR
ncbi:MAG: OmpA family protein [candidate division NC10 bacterium]|uniref:OmpA family protein n=1 Tax=Tectimicrobiota bacterium TaxID=2528274 RepID=A0A932HZ84_UNCTE|nr:OmpA family protein [candidate division NC10 bacterium]MBI3128356.1 OmpA family protein [Candidatus Tectomicrobia bacterium]